MVFRRIPLQAPVSLLWLTTVIAGCGLLFVLNSANEASLLNHISRRLQVYNLPKYDGEKEQVTVFYNSSHFIYGKHLKEGNDYIGSGKYTKVSSLFGLDRVNRSKTLELVHITKTGGSAIEMGAAASGMRWGACHYAELPHLGCTQPPDWEFPLALSVPDHLKSKTHCEPWHSPPHWLEPNPQPKDSFVNFVVVRDPYQRALSEFYCSAFGVFGGQNITDESGAAYDEIFPHTFGLWIAEKLHEETDYFGHLLPQHYYVFDFNTGERMVDHVLRYETLDDEFNMLMFLYGLNVKLPDKNVSQSSTFVVKKSSRITMSDMSSDTIKLINDHFRLDFELFGYTMIEA